MNGIQSSQFFCEKYGFREIYPLNSALADYFEELFDENLGARTLNFSEPEFFNKDEYSPWSTAQPFSTPASTSKRFPEPSISVPQLPAKERRGHTVECAFCKNNGEVANFYRSHRLKDRDGRVICPVLRMYTCPICHTQGGDWAHTIKYCPMNRSSEIVSTISTLSTLRMSNGRMRK